MKLLRRTLFADAATCAATGALLVAAAGPLSGLLGLPAELLRYAGFALFPCAALMIFAALRQPPSRALGWIVFLGNVAWIAGSVLVLFITSPSALGYAFVVAQAVAVAVLAELEYAGLARAAA